jgi:hypothetical protein
VVSGLKAAAREAATRKLYCFGVLGCLKAIGRVLERCHRAPLAGLVYPFVQIVEAYHSVCPSSNYIPLALHLAEILTRLSSAHDLMIPLVPKMIVRVLQSEHFKRNKATLAGEGFDLDLGYQISETRMKGVAVWTDILQKCLLLLGQYCLGLMVGVSTPEQFLALLSALKHIPTKFGNPLHAKALLSFIKCLKVSS